MKTKNLEFQISQLRQDKIIFAIEAVAINITCLVASSFLSLVVNFIPDFSMYLYYANIAFFAFGIGYTFYALIGNLKRLRQIKLLEKEL